MGFFDSINKALNDKSTEMAFANAQNMYQMMENIRRCSDPEMKEQMKRRITNTMMRLKNVAMSGSGRSEEAMYVYQRLVDEHGREFEREEIRYK